MSTVKKESRELDQSEKERQDKIARMPTLEQCFNLMDFEAVARYVMKKKAWAYYSSGADDEIASSDYASTRAGADRIHQDNARKSLRLP